MESWAMGLTDRKWPNSENSEPPQSTHSRHTRYSEAVIAIDLDDERS
jgi:hypothetical protein